MRSLLVCSISAVALFALPAAAQTADAAPAVPATDAAAPAAVAPADAPPPIAPAVAPPVAAAPDVAPQAQDRAHGVTNLQGPIDLQWHALGVLEFPGLGGLRLGATFYTPVVPVYLGLEGARSWGVSPSHLAGERAGFFGREVGGTFTLEARAGLSFEHWGRETQNTSYHDAIPADGMVHTVTVYTNTIMPPVYHRWSLYGGFRSRSTPGSTPCPTDNSTLPVDCSETAQNFVFAGFETMASQDSEFPNAELTLKTKYTTTWNLNLLVSGKNDYGRTGFGKRIGGEIVYTLVNAGLGLSVRGGWDGENALLSMGFGAGASHALLRPVPTSTALPP